MLPPRPTKPGAPILAQACALLCGPAFSQSVVFSDVHTLAAATQAVPVEETFSVSAAGTYQITLTDLGAQLTPSAPLATVKLAVTGGTAIVGTPLLMPGSTTINATPGNYIIHVVGTQGNVPGSGPIGIQVTNTATNAVLASFSDTLAVAPQPLPSSEAVLSDTLPPANGSYTVSIADLQLPQSLTLMTLLLIQQGGATPLAILPDPTNNGALSKTVTLNSGMTYNIFAIGQTSSTATGGLFSTVVIPQGGGAPLYARTIAVGGTTHVGSPVLAAGNYTLKLSDFGTPTALTQLEGEVVMNGSPVATLAAAGSQNFAVAASAAGTYDAFAFAAPSSAAAPTVDAGSYGLDVLPQGGGTAALDAARAVAVPGSSVAAYSFGTSLQSPGNYTLTAVDFQLPAALTSLKVLAVQGGVVLGSVTGGASAASTSVSGAAGPVTLLAFAQAGNAAAGLFGADLTTSGGKAPAFEVTQGVGALFAARQFTLTAAGNYSAAATDLAFPASFANLDVIVTQGTNLMGSIFGGGTFFFQGAPGSYFINFIAQPTGSDEAGTYAVTVTTAPPAPVIALSADHTSVGSGSAVDLSWSTQNATTCTATPAAGGFTGSQPLSGVFTSAALTSTTTFTLQCTGAGGTQTQSVAVTVTAASSSGHGGGGGIQPELLLLLLGMVLCRATAFMSSSPTMPRVPGSSSDSLIGE